MATSSPASTNRVEDSTGGRLVLAAAMVLAAVLGTIHAFSVFLVPMEQLFEATRGAVSAAYSIALVSLTVAVLLGHRLYAAVSAPVFSALLLTAAALGTVIAAFAPVLPMVWLGYGLVFGGANGLGYGYALQASAQANHARSGLAMGLVTAAYALGAFVSPVVFDLAIAAGGVSAGMLALAGALLAARHNPPVSNRLVRASDSGTANMLPEGCSCIRRPRTDTNFNASLSEKTPA